MLRGLYTATAGMMTQQRRHDTVTQNIANINTTGYKQVESIARSFPEVMVALRSGDEGRDNRNVGKLNTGVFAEESISMMVQGDITETQSSDDLALISDIQVANPQGGNVMFDASGKAVLANGQTVYKPQAFFNVENPEGGISYTRDGDLNLAADGRLVTSMNQNVLGQDGQPIILAGSMDDYWVRENGTIFNKVTGAASGRIGVTIAEQPNGLTRDGEGLFTEKTQGAGALRAATDADQFEVKQGYLERSTVDAAQSMVDLTAALRAYEANQKIVQFYDKSLEKAVNEVGRVN
ncbi:flagellar hook-basal body protein [Saccharibacillus kuerlensis]|uniref:Flagellar hook-basal body complex protein FlhO n=1 Tax=Saccharibacillus kuerlensis TaxID=459527 RepID=A0ABQ2KW16_9BACL|nr:flagellar hook-basal body protein [Saccharibacillus kuerlensis]GGN93318.1 flagellar hook-basal body complex protein FlhO [Saccharibacillus kuerlensis]